MILRRTYAIEDWNGWDDAIHRGALDFRGHFAIWPNIMLANPRTYWRIDMMAMNGAHRARVTGPQGETLEPGEMCSLSSFCYTGHKNSPGSSGRGCSEDGGLRDEGLPGYEIGFYVREDVPTGCFLLVHDSDPGGGGEPFPDEDTPDDALDAGAGGAGRLA